MQLLATLMQGKKTYTGIIMFALGFLGFSGYVTEGEVTQAVDLSLQVVGIVLAWYGRAVAKPQ